MNRLLSVALVSAPVVIASLVAFSPTPCGAQGDRTGALTFESSTNGAVAGWGTVDGSVFLDSTVVHGGRYAARLEHRADVRGLYTGIGRTIPLTFLGDTVELRGWLKTEGVTIYAGFWMEEDDRSRVRQWVNMQKTKLRGTTDWAEYHIRVPLDARARTISMGVQLWGDGVVWADDLELLVDGRPPEAAPVRVLPPDPLASDTEFDSGSRIAMVPLSESRIDNLTLLGKVWGFAKYHHPRIVGGQVNWDYELFHVLPAVLAAGDRRSAAHVMAAWLAKLGDPPACSPCVDVPADARLLPDVEWIHDSSALGAELSRRLETIYRNRPHVDEQYYVFISQGAGNPVFDDEAAYGDMARPDAGYRLLALYRFWNVVEYWYPDRDVMGEDWDGVLRDFVPRFMAAGDTDAYRSTTLELVAHIHDTHANRWDDPLRPPRGPAKLPVVLRFVEGKAVVVGYSNDTLGPATSLRPGDVIEALDGAPVDSLLEVWRPYYSSSNETAQMRDLVVGLTRGPEGPVLVRGTRGTRPFTLKASRVPVGEIDQVSEYTFDRPGEAFQRLTPEVAYLKLSAVKYAELGDYMRKAAGTGVFVIDIRDYPNEMVVHELAGHFATRPTAFARFSGADISNPGAFLWWTSDSLEVLEPHYAGKLVVLVGETTQSQAEHTAMALRAVGALVVGSTTAGADGDVSRIPLPGGLSPRISGTAVFYYPDDTPVQRIGVVPDMVVRPTIAGIRAGRDEVLEAAVSHALGREFRLP